MSREHLQSLLVGGVALSLFAGAAAGAAPPSSGLVLGLSADSGVTTNNNGVVTAWNDENTNAQRINRTVGSPSLQTGILFPNGTTHNVVNFPGASGLELNDAPALSLQKLNIFVVADTTQNQTSGEFITNYHNNNGSHGWAVGNSDSNAGQVKWFTGPDGSDTLGGTTGLTLTAGTYYAIHTSADPSTGKTADTYDGTTLNHASEATYGNGSNQITYDGSEVPAVGFLDAFGTNGIQNLMGNIAEVLVYDDTNLTPTQITAETNAVGSYLNAKYFATPEPATLSLLALGGMLAARRPRRHR